MKNIIILFLILFVILGCDSRKNDQEQETEKILQTTEEKKSYQEVFYYDQDFLRNIDITNPRMNGSDITILQKKLLELGFAGVGEVDGYYGQMTGDEIYFIKRVLGLVNNPDYMVNRDLWRILFDPEKAGLLNRINSMRHYFDESDKYFTRELDITKPAMNGSDIAALQARLLGLGFTGIGEITGYYDVKMEEEINFIKSVLDIIKSYQLYDTEIYIKEPEDSLFYKIDRNLWEIIFDLDKSIILKSISLIRPFYEVKKGHLSFIEECNTQQISVEMKIDHDSHHIYYTRYFTLPNKIEIVDTTIVMPTVGVMRSFFTISLYKTDGIVIKQNFDDFEYKIEESQITITGYNGWIRDVVIPEKIKGLPVVAIDDYAFMKKRLTSIVIPNTVVAIGEYAFAHNWLIKIVIPDSVAYVGNMAFDNNSDFNTESFFRRK